MPTIQSAYQKAILDARNLYLDELLPDVLEALEADYIRMLNDIVADFGTGAINEQRANDLYQSVIDRLEELSIRLGRTFDKAQLEAAELAVSGHAAGVKAVSELAGTPVSFNFATVANKALEQYVTRRQTVGVATNFRTLFNRHIVEMAPEVDQFLTSAVGRGVGGRRGALELAKMMARGEPGLLAQLDKVARGGTSHFTEIPGGAEYTRLRKILYDARRIMVSETNNMYFEADRVASVESPVVDLVKWTISGRHHAVSSSPDACDVYAESDLHGYGPGIYHPENVPQKPHPHCLCQISSITRPPADWGKPKRPVPTPRRSAEEQAREIMERSAERVKSRGGSPRSITEKHLKRQNKIVNTGLNAANQALTETV